MAVTRYGKPRALRSDNEPVFRSKLLRIALKVLGIRQQFAQPHSPWQNGRIERLFGTLKPLLRRLALPGAGALDTALFEFRLFYNHVRTHQNLGGRTPAEVWAADSDRAPLPPARAAPKLVSALGGLLVGYYLRR
jgi:putative transposase